MKPPWGEPYRLAHSSSPLYPTFSLHFGIGSVHRRCSHNGICDRPTTLLNLSISTSRLKARKPKTRSLTGHGFRSLMNP
ncbi:hypothetical protein [Kamptonema formosum]|uniref:hypothetical protein n=1 Tax=Kamptonema formosum TaxID=331992 RepID=UPI0011D26B18|nr:hypothetical protein [Kamptonema formosum]